LSADKVYGLASNIRGKVLKTVLAYLPTYLYPVWVGEKFILSAFRKKRIIISA
jgi:hypothetical protein